jgi:DNA processing protein
MRISQDQLSLLGLCQIKGIDWKLLAREAQRPGGLDRLLAGELTERTPEAAETAALIAQAFDSDRNVHALRAAAHAEDERAAAVGADLVTVLDPGYPRTLRLIFNLPPFLYVKGRLLEQDLRSVAVVGTREPTEDGLERAALMAQLLVDAHVTVVSGPGSPAATPRKTRSWPTGSPPLGRSCRSSGRARPRRPGHSPAATSPCPGSPRARW